MSEQKTPAADSPTTPPLPLRSAIVTSVQWDRVIEFTQIFRGFRLAINPAKILIALLAIVLIYLAGRCFDVVWGPQVYVGEIESFQTDRAEVFREQRGRQIDSRKSAIYSMILLSAGAEKSPSAEHIKELQEHPRAAYREIKNLFLEKYAKELADIRKSRESAEALRAAVGPMPGDRTPADDEIEARVAAAKHVQADITNLRKTIGTGIFASFLDYELRQFDALVTNTLSLVRISPVRSTLGTGAMDFDSDASTVSAGIVSTSPERFWRSDTVVGCAANMTITGPLWLVSGTGPIQYRPENAGTWGGWVQMYGYRAAYIVSLVAFLGFCLATLALAGGMICRLSALEIAGVERPLLKDVFLFVRRRLAVFLKVPLAPLVIILALGAGMAILSLGGAIPFVGEILLGILFIAFLAIAFVLMLLVLGLLGGFHLLYPTLAVEGSDTFDAMSRAFAYVYARPWRLTFYTLVALFYGVLTLLFVSFAVYVILLLTHTFVGWGVSLFGYNHGWQSGMAKLNTLWPTPRFGHLINPINWYAMSGTERMGAFFLHFWCFLVIGCIGAYVMSYYFSVHTMIYLLIRRSVDGQGLAEVCPNDAPAATPSQSVPAQAAPPAPAAAASATPEAPAPAAPTERGGT
jgi:hypothetical protein